MSRAPCHVVCLGVMVVAACVEPPGASDVVETRVETQALGQQVCDDVLICPGNSDILGALGPYELSTSADQVSPRGFRLDSIKKGGLPLAWFQVTGAALSGALAGGIPIGGPPDWVNTKFRVIHDSGQQFDLIIEGYQLVPFFDLAKAPRIVGFMVKYQMIAPIRGDREDLCPYKDELGSGEARTWAVFWKGDRYDPDTGDIFASGLGDESKGHVGDWFNISCAGEATIKMLRDEIGNAVTPGSSTDRSQATLNMLTAKYCPGPERYTKLGQRLSWDDKWSSAKLGLIKSHEAIWTPTGAACLDTPRMVERDEVDCEIPTCDDMIDDWGEHGELISGNPLVLFAKAP
jgi:hypothetical protein